MPRKVIASGFICIPVIARYPVIARNEAIRNHEYPVIVRNEAILNHEYPVIARAKPEAISCLLKAFHSLRKVAG
jgi:hypothetical protein